MTSSMSTWVGMLNRMESKAKDLLASNFDRISQILPNSKQLPDFNGSQPGTPKKQNESTMLQLQQLLNENQELK